MITKYVGVQIDPAKLCQELLDDGDIGKLFVYDGQKTNQLIRGRIYTNWVDTWILIHETVTDDGQIEAAVPDQAFKDAVDAVLAAHTP